MDLQNRILNLKIDYNIQFSLSEIRSLLTEEELQELLIILQNELSFDNPAWLKAKIFAGRKHFFSRVPAKLCFYKLRRPKTEPTIELPIGYLEKFCQHCKAFSLLPKAINKLIKNPEYFQSNIQLRDYQQLAVQTMLKRHRGYLVAPCGAGKTVMGLELIARRQQKALVIVHTNDLLKQWCQSAVDFLDCSVGQISSRQKTFQNPITVATVQSLIRHPTLMATLAAQIGTLLVDECHHVPAVTFTKVISSFRPNYLYGCSATPEREDGLSNILRLFIGPELYAIKSRLLQKQEHLLRPSLQIIPTDFFYDWNNDKPEQYSEMLDNLVNDRLRNQLICQELQKHPTASNLILSERIAHCIILKKMLEKENPAAVTALLTGKTPPFIREQILKKARDKEVNYIFATKLADEGLDIKCLEHLWLVSPSRSVNRAQQRIGRIMRIADEKKQPIVFDFLDHAVSVLLSQFRSRFYQVYRKLLVIPQDGSIEQYFTN